MIADPHELRAFVRMKVRVFALFGAVAAASFMLLAAPQALAVLMASIDRLGPGAHAALRASCLAMPAVAAVALALARRQRRQARPDAARR